VRLAAHDARTKLFALAAPLLGAKAEDLDAAGGKIFVAATPSKSIGFRQEAVRKKTSTASRPHSSIVSRIVITLPSDFDIFSPVKRSMPLCAQIEAKG